jgi:hypothetical protein
MPAVKRDLLLHACTGLCTGIVVTIYHENKSRKPDTQPHASATGKLEYDRETQ